MNKRGLESAKILLVFITFLSIVDLYLSLKMFNGDFRLEFNPIMAYILIHYGAPGAVFFKTIGPLVTYLLLNRYYDKVSPNILYILIASTVMYLIIILISMYHLYGVL